MDNQIAKLLEDLKANDLKFSEVISFIESLYQHTPTAFKNGAVFNQSDQNQGSAKVFFFAQMHQLSVENSLLLFAEHYQAVIASPEGNDHQNIRQFMQNGWEGIQFENAALK